ncbi:hypothetical protein RM553_03190 [Zunongwangia sp. F363]|uniref:Uncharacterized protein n=1 Tax=Autumnicola tepida TaxID=3075595 RepID=A0ABU3C656_9FLAO|nr:hypothetical protein [Zunongwangia sp. F363]MDT0641829.1 hypothetical protein [Zunongwangia sp. F363]
MDIILKRAIVGGVVSTIVMGTGTFILGELSGYKAMELLSSSLSGINMLCNTVILGSSTILALMLTLLSISRAADSSLTQKHYQDVLRLAKYDTVLIITAIITFLMLNLPIVESHEVPENWYVTIYYVSLGMAAILGGGLIAIVTMLYGTISNIILIVGLGVKDHPLVNSEDDNEAKEEVEQRKEEKERDKSRSKQPEQEKQNA